MNLVSSMETSKKRVAQKAASLLSNMDSIVGVGTGSTVKYFITEISARSLPDLSYVPTSVETEMYLRSLNLPVINLPAEGVKIAIDGADQVAQDNLFAIKGAGAALTREKIVAKSSKQFIIIIDQSKLVESLGNGIWLPVEVLPFGLERTKVLLENKLESRTQIRVGSGKAGPVITDNRNYIIDVWMEDAISDPVTLEKEIKQIPGVIESGLFAFSANKVLIGTETDVKELEHRVS